MKIKYILPAILCASGLWSVQAQNDEKEIKREMLLEKEYVPTIMKASRINTVPETREPQVRKPRLEFSNYALPMSLSPRINMLESLPLFTNVTESDKRGYANLGIGSNLNIDGDLGYQILNTDKDALGVYFSHRSANEKLLYLQEKRKQKMAFNDTWGGIAYSHKFNTFRLFTDLKYTHSAFNYYGYGQTLMPDTLINFDINKKQTNGIVDFSLGAATLGEDDLNCLVRLSFYNYNQKYATTQELDGPGELSGKFDWDFNYRFSGENKYGIRGYMQVFSYDIDQPEYGTYYTGYKSHTRLALNPYISFNDVSWKAHLGLKTFFTFKYGKAFVFAPDLAFSVFPTANSELYLTADGGITSNSNYAMYRINRYTTPQNRVLDTRTNLDGQFGFKMNVNGSIWFDLFTGYRIDRDAFFFRPEAPHAPVPISTSIAENVAVADTMHANLFKLGLHTKYQYQDMLELGIRMQYNVWDVDNFDYTGDLKSKAWNMPAFECDLTAGYEFGFPLRLDLLYHLETGRTAYLKAVERTEKMKNINDLNLTASYSVNEYLSVYAKCNNILMQKYDLWYGYRTQGSHIMLGATLKF